MVLFPLEWRGTKGSNDELSCETGVIGLWTVVAFTCGRIFLESQPSGRAEWYIDYCYLIVHRAQDFAQWSSLRLTNKSISQLSRWPVFMSSDSVSYQGLFLLCSKSYRGVSKGACLLSWLLDYLLNWSGRDERYKHCLARCLKWPLR